MASILNMLPVYIQPGGSTVLVPGEPLDVISNPSTGVVSDNLCFILFEQGPYTNVKLIPAGGTIPDGSVYIGGICMFNQPYGLFKVI